MKKTIFISVVFLFAFLSASSIFAQVQADALRMEAQKQMQFGRYGEAIDLLNKYISARPQEALGYNLRGICYEKRKDYENAVYDYRSALKLEPNNKDISTNLSRATTAWQSLLYNKIEGHKRELAINPNAAKNYLEIGKCYKNLGEWATAEEWYDQYLAREEASPDEIIRYSEILAKNNHIAKGEPILKKYTEKFPNDHRLWSRYGYFTLWLGKFKISIDAFEHALALRPFFQEALDGLDLAKGNGYVYTINDTSVKYNAGRGPVRKVFEYPIDRDYRLLKRTPNNNELRFKLVKELVDAKRYEEATEQLDILSRDTTSNVKIYNQYSSDLQARLDKIYHEKVNEYSALVKNDPTNKKAVMGLAEYYDRIKDYDSGLKVLDDYLAKTSSGNNNDVKYLYAQLSAKNRDFSKALTVVDELLQSEPNNYKYQLFRSQLSVWSGRDLDKVKPVLENMIAKNPKDVPAMLTLASLTLQQKDFDASRGYLNQIKKIDPTNPTLDKLESDFAIAKIAAEQERLFEILQEGRQLSYENRCNEALAKYDEYMAKAEPNVIVQREYADVNVCAKNYSKAISIYNDLLSQSYDYDTDLMRAKTYYYMEDSVDALSSFQKLAKDKPDDFIVNLYLGDSYAKMHQFDEAADVYDRMKENMQLDSSQTAMIEMREGWLPRGGFGSALSSFPSYAMLSPYGAYYGDNLGFRFNTQGIRFDLGVTSFMTIGVEGNRTTLSNNSTKENINNIKWNLMITLMPNTTLGIGLGNSYYANSGRKTLADAFLKSEVPDHYSAVLSFSRVDAAQVLFSPNLVNTREYTDLTRFTGFYNFKNNFRISTDFSYLNITDGNSGYKLNMRFGKYFYPEVLIGYEYEGLNFSFVSPGYYSPQNYSSHSLFGDFDLYKSKDKLTKVSVGGKVGLIARSSYIIRQLYGSFSWAAASKFTLQGTIAYGSTFQNTLGYSSFSAYFGAFWNL